MRSAEQIRIEASPGLHGAHCQRCDYLFDAFNTPTPLNDAIMRMKTTRCPQCSTRDKLFLLMPFKYREMVAARIEAERRREAVRQIADKYIPR